MTGRFEEALRKITVRQEQLWARQRAFVPTLMTHVVLGYPSLRESIDIIKLMADSGVGFVEIQIPFSDPMADGPTIMEANEVALGKGITPHHCMQAVDKLRTKVPIPIFLMSYFNILHSYGIQNSSAKRSGVSFFCRDAANAGVDGLIVPDIPADDLREHYWEISREYNLVPIPLVAPVTNKDRIKKVKKISRDGFVYCVSTTGTTGVRGELPPGLGNYLTQVKRSLDLPLAVGFGISTAQQVKSLGKHAEIAVVGSATIDLIKKTPKKKRNAQLKKFLNTLIAQ